MEDAVDPVKVCLAQFNWLDHEDLFRGLLDQCVAFRRVDEAEVEDYMFAALGVALTQSGIPQHLVTRILKLVVKTPTDQLDGAHVAIVNGGYLSTPSGVYTLPELKPIEDPTLVPLQTIVFSLSGFWELSQKALCAQSA